MKTIVCKCGNRIAVHERNIKALKCSKCSLSFVNIFCGRRGEALRGKEEIVERGLHEN
ncbi:MAG: hypothetical protein AABW89_05095 [Nanoarchaeota archaeon]